MEKIGTACTSNKQSRALLLFPHSQLFNLTSQNSNFKFQISNLKSQTLNLRSSSSTSSLRTPVPLWREIQAQSCPAHDLVHDLTKRVRVFQHHQVSGARLFRVRARCPPNEVGDVPIGCRPFAGDQMHRADPLHDSTNTIPIGRRRRLRDRRNVVFDDLEPVHGVLPD